MTRAPTTEYPLNQHSVDLWLEYLPSIHLQHTAAATSLSNYEIERAKAFHFDGDRERYIASHKLLRFILNRYLQLSGTAIEFTLGAQGKPAIAAPQNASDIEFNMAHSGDYVAIAIGKARPVGVDIEMISQKQKLDQLAEHCFSAEEYRQYCSVQPHFRYRAFFRGWARKEAYIKALGMGLSKNLKTFSVDIFSEHSPQVILEKEQAFNMHPWKLWPVLQLEKHNCAGALVTDASINHINYRSTSLELQAS